MREQANPTTKFPALPALGLLLLTGCASITHVRPVPRGAVVAEVSAGGPLVQVGGGAIPLPLTSVGATYGLLERLSLHGHVQPSPLMFGALGGDVGATGLLLEERGARPALAASGQVHVLTDFRTASWWSADASLTASWLLGGRWMPYVTATGQVDFLNRLFQVAPGVGAQVLLERWTIQAEARLYSPTRRSDIAAVPYVGLAGHGAFGLVLGAGYRFGP
jgi:hypothetical protein